MATRINVTRVPYNYEWPGRSAVTCISTLGHKLVKDELAEDAIKRGYAEPFNPVTKPATKAKRRATPKANASPSRRPARVDRANLAAADRTDDLPPVDDAG